jgi:hypothetical protein
MFERDGTPAGNFRDIFLTAIEFISPYEMVVGLDGGEIQQITYDASERTFTVSHVYQSHGGRVNDIKYNPETTEILSAGNDHIILVQKL